MAFDPDEYLASKESANSSFDPDAYLGASPDGDISEFESGVRGLAQGASFGFADELTGGIESLLTDKTYEEARNESRANYDAAREENPLSYAAGEVGGSVATAFVPGLGALNAAKGAGLATRAGLAAAQGGLSGLGLSSEEDALGMAKDTAFGAGIGGSIPLAGAALRPVASKMAQSAGQGLKSFAEKAALNATGATGKQVSEFADDAGRQLLDRGIVRFGDSQSQIAGRAAGAVQAANQQIDSALSSLEAQGANVDANEIYAVIRKKITELQGDPSQADVAKMLEKELDNLISATDARGSSSFGLQAAEKIKRGYNRKAGNWMDPEKGMVGKEMYQTYRGAVEDAAHAADPATAALFEEGKKSYGLLAPIQEAAERRAATTSQSPVGGLLDMATMTADVSAGGPGVLGPIARRLVSPRISSSAAAAADNVSKILLKSPQMQQLSQKNPAAFRALVQQFQSQLSAAEGSLPRAADKDESANNFNRSMDKGAVIQRFQGTKYSQVLQNAAEKGEQSFAAAHYVLQNQDPEYRKMMGE